MKSTIVVTRNYFSHDWSLVVLTEKFCKSFYLGQDVKFCKRVLGMEPSEVVKEIGSGDLTNESILNKLSHFIIDTLGLTEEKLEELNEWELCCQ